MVATVHGLPMPPTPRASWVTDRYAGRVPTFARRQWNEVARAAVKRAALRPFRGRVTISIRAGTPHRRRDLQTLVEPIVELLCWAAVIETDDARVLREVRLIWDPGVAAEHVDVTVRSLVA